MAAIKVHLSKVRKNAFGGITTGTLCNRFRILAASANDDGGMNLTTEPAEVTCAFCRKAIFAAEFYEALRNRTLPAPKGPAGTAVQHKMLQVRAGSEAGR